VKLTVKLTLKRKIIGLAVFAAVLPVLVMFMLTVQFQKRASQKAETELDVLAEVNITQIAKDVYVLCETAGHLLERKVLRDMDVARTVLKREGGASLSSETAEWDMVNQETKQSARVVLRKMLIGGRWPGQVRDRNQPVPAVDEITRLTGSPCSIFQRMNEQGDMARIATTVENTDNTRAVGTYISAVGADGAPNPVVEAILKGEPYQGLAYVVSDWYSSLYEPITDASGAVIGMLFTGERLGTLETVRKGITGIKVGKTGYVAVLGGKGAHKGQYIISYKGERDGENILESRDAQGKLFIQEMVDAALERKSGETFTRSYWWKNPGESAPREKNSVICYYEPWDWVIFTTMYADDYVQAREQFESATRTLLLKLFIGGLIILALVIWLAFFVGNRMAAPLNRVIGFAERIASGDVLEAKNGLAAHVLRAGGNGNGNRMLVIDDADETGQLVDAFKRMAESLDSLIGKVQQSGIQVTALATEIAASAQHLQATVSEQAASTREVTATSREISVTSNDLVQTMDEVNDSVSETANTAEQGRDILRSNSEVMDHLLKSTGSISSKLAIISEKANKISTVGATINKISDQTNLLSLNAAIEAEKAGEYGRGFSVVAREISRLADQTAIATQDIADMVRGMQSSVSAGVMEMDKFAEEVRRGVQEVISLGAQLEQIIDRVRSLSPRFETVKEGMHAQDQGARQISEAIGQLAQAADQTKDSLLDFKQATERANAAVRELQKEVSRFRIST
jgi:methyl-accepting chemotaxis protein WspA